MTNAREVFAASSDGRIAVGPVYRDPDGGFMLRVALRLLTGAVRIVGLSVPNGADSNNWRAAFIADLEAMGATVSVAADMPGLSGTLP